MHHLRSVFTKEKEEKAKFKLESKEKLKDEKKDKTKDKEKEKVKDKDKEKFKEKDKDKKDKKLTKMPSTVTSGVPFEEIFTLGVALPIFGVPLQQSVERSRCHDDTGLPLVVRESIDYLQAHGLKSSQIYRAEADKIKLQQLRKLFTDRAPTFPYHWDVPVACAMLKGFISELPESILTQELHGQFEQATAIAPPVRDAAVAALVRRLPAHCRALLSWLAAHCHAVLAHEQWNHATVQTLVSYLGPALNFSLNLFTYLVTNAEILFPDVCLTKYVPPLANLPAEFPPCAVALSAELRKQESLLSQIHAEMHAGFITPARDHQLWEAQRIVTQLKRKLRFVQKSGEPNLSQQQPSMEEKQEDDISRRNSQTTDNQTDTELKSPNDGFQDESPKAPDATFEPNFPKEPAFEPNFPKEANFEPNFPKEATFEPSFPKSEAAFEPNFPKEANFEPNFPKEAPFEPNFPKETSFEPSFSQTDAKFEPSFSKVDATFEPSFPKVPEPTFEPTFPKSEPTFSKLPSLETAFEPIFDAEFEDNFEFRTEKGTPDHEIPPAEPVKEKPKFTEKELKILRLELENAEYLQLKSLLQAKINSEQFEIVKLRSHVALKNKQESLQNKENKENLTPEDQELKQKLIKENAILEQKRLNLINQIFQERVACIQLKIELAMKEILSKS